MQFLNPIWLLSGLGIVIPIAIHLWNQRPGKLLEVGSIRFVEPNTNKRSAQIQLKDILLLILRCLIILLLACFLAKPIWNSTQLSSNKGWMIMPAGYVKEAYQAYPSIIDSLIKEGVELHLLENDFPKADFTTELGKDAKKGSLNYWELGKMLQDIAPANSASWFFTPNIKSAYQGEKPKINSALNWLVFPVKINPISEIVEAYQISKDSVEVKMSHAKRDGWGIEGIRLSIRNNLQHDYRFFDSAGNVYIAYLQQQAVKLDQSILQIFIYTDQFQQDANYLNAAIKAIVDFTGRRIQCKVVNTFNEIPKQLDWLFWLSYQKPMQGFSKNVWYYQPGVISQVNSKIYSQGDLASNGIAIYQMMANTTSSNQHVEKIWTNGFGGPILQKNELQQYQLNTRFNPEWNDLVWSKEFPLWMMHRLIPTTNQLNVDIRAIDANQVLPIKEKNGEDANNQNANTWKNQGKDLSWLFWILLCIMLAIERLVTYYQAKMKMHA